MPDPWQRRFVAALQELEAAFAHITQADGFRVNAVDCTGRFIKDPVPHYNRGLIAVTPHLPDKE